MKFVFLIAALITFNISLSQSFEFEYSTEQDDCLWNVIENEEGYIYCVGHLADPDSPKYSGLILKLNPQGELVDQRIINVPNRTYDIFGILQDSIGSLILYGKTCDTTLEQLNTRFVVITIDYSLNVIDSANYYIDSQKWMSFLSNSIGLNGDLLFAGGLLSDTNPKSTGVLLRLNHSLDSIRFHLSHVGAFHQIKQLSDSVYWALRTISIATLDTLFEYVDGAPTPELIGIGYGLKWDSDSSFYMSAEWNGGTDDNLAIIRQHYPLHDEDYLFNTWGTEGIIDFPSPNGGLDFNNKDSVFFGATSPFWPWQNYPSNYVLLQTDSLLNIRWEKFYGNRDFYYELISIEASNDGGCILAGTRYDYNAGVKKRDIYIVKVDGEGLLVGNEETPTIEMHDALVYPNPGTTEIKVRIAAQYRKSLFQLFDMNGKQVAMKKIVGKWGSINTSFLKPGAYIYRISSEDGLFETGKWVKQ